MSNDQNTHKDGFSPLADRHLWQIQPVRDVLLIALVGLVIYIGYLMRIVTVPLLLALMLAYLLEPIVSRIARTIGRTAAAITVIITALLAVGLPFIALTGLAVVQGVAFLRTLRDGLPSIRDQIDEWRHNLRERTGVDLTFGGEVDEETAALIEQAVENGEAPARESTIDWFTVLEQWLDQNQQAIANTIMGGGVSALSLGWTIIGTIGYIAFTLFFLVPMFFFFMSVGLGRLLDLGERVIPEGKRKETLALLGKMDRVISAFIRGRIVIALILAVLFTIGWWAIGVPAPLVLGPLTGLLAAIPYLGVIGWPVAIIAMWLGQAGEPEPVSWWVIVLLPTVVYWAIQLTEDYVLNPLIQGKATGLDTPTIIVAVLGAGAVAGLYGVLVAIPVAACVKILITDVFWPRYLAWTEGRERDPLPLS